MSHAEARFCLLGTATVGPFAVLESGTLGIFASPEPGADCVVAEAVASEAVASPEAGVECGLACAVAEAVAVAVSPEVPTEGAAADCKEVVGTKNAPGKILRLANRVGVVISSVKRRRKRLIPYADRAMEGLLGLREEVSRTQQLIECQNSSGTPLKHSPWRGLCGPLGAKPKKQ